MAEVTGPISSLPGASFEPPAGTVCDHHPDQPAVRRVQGETDSMGSEMHDLCQACITRLRTEKAEPAHCDFCKKVDILRPYRDYEEGMCGPVYQICCGCRTRRNAQDQADLDADSFWDSE